jgi:hypothetical protein
MRIEYRMSHNMRKYGLSPYKLFIFFPIDSLGESDRISISDEWRGPTTAKTTIESQIKDR